jgi:hypothetical protein
MKSRWIRVLPWYYTEAKQPSRADDMRRSIANEEAADGPDDRASWQDDPGQVTDARLADIAADLELAFSGVTVAQMIARVDAQSAELRAARVVVEAARAWRYSGPDSTEAVDNYDASPSKET